MSTTITAISTSASVTPLLVLGYETTRTSRNIVYDLLDGGIGIVLGSPRPRSGTLELLFDDETSAFAALTLHEQETTFSLADEDRPSVDMTYVLGEGDLSLTLDSDTRTAWVLAVPYQEVDA